MSESETLCPQCKAEIHPDAKVCPHCNYRLHRGGAYHIGTLIAALGLVILIGGLLFDPFSGLLWGGLLLLIGYVIRRN